ncbi:MAG TPA: AraC family transcriptional regulator [Armatimonadota bacterium]|jgi:AraC-like DNA-binding protein
MLESHKEIRQTRKDSTSARVAALPLRHAGLSPLREMAVLISGVDARAGRQEWGEGVSPTHLLFFVTEGQVHYMAADPPLTASPGQLLIVPGGLAKQFLLDVGAFRVLWFHLLDTPAWAQLRADHASVRPAKYLSIIDTVQGQLLAECRYDDATTIESCVLLSRLLANYLTREVLQHETVECQRRQVLLHALWAEVHAHPEYAWSVAELAARAGMSSGHFHRIVRAQQHTGPMDIVTRIRMELAASLLRTTDWPIDRVAAAVGYLSPYAFSHAFLRYAGMRPGAFRQQ